MIEIENKRKKHVKNCSKRVQDLKLKEKCWECGKKDHFAKRCRAPGKPSVTMERQIGSEEGGSRETDMVKIYAILMNVCVNEKEALGLLWAYEHFHVFWDDLLMGQGLSC